MKSSFVNMGLCAVCSSVSLTVRGVFFRISERKLRWVAERKGLRDQPETGSNAGIPRRSWQQEPGRKQAGTRCQRERDALWWVEHSWLSAEVWAALKSTLAALGGGQQGLHLVGEAQGRTELLRGLKGARI